MDEKSSLGMGHYLAVLRRHWKTVVAAMLIGLLLALAYLLTGGARVTASALVNVNVIVSDPFNPSRPASGLLDAATEGEIASSYVVASEASKEVPGGDSTADLRNNVDVKTGTDGTTALISYSSRTEARAVDGADAMATSYLAYRQEQADARRTTMRNQLEEQLAGLNTSLAAPGADRVTLTNRISNIEFEINELNAIDTTGGTVITPAAESPVSTNYTRVLGSGLAGGLVAGVLLAFLSHALRRRINDGYDVEQAGSGPVLAELVSPEPTLPARGAELDAYRAVRERLFAGRGPVTALAVIDATSGRAFYPVAPNLSVVLAQAGFEVELVLMGTTPEEMELMTEALQLRFGAKEGGAEVLVSESVPGLRVVEAARGASDHDADDYVTDAVRRRFLARKDSSPVVVLALPANAPSASRMAAARLAGAAVLTVEGGRTRKGEVEMTATELAGVRAELLGTLLVRGGRRMPHKPRTAEQKARRRAPEPVAS
ncbi:hypothetical protein D6T65_08975 [Arthrobacter frigidicola]|nr:hypothetical protein D6T65_08975 [Arthrobacter frigidicola]